MERRWVGQSVPRVEDEALLRGRGRFLDDLNPVPGAAQVAFVRSPFAHARIDSVDVKAAAEAPGVMGVVTGAQLAAVCAPMGAVIPCDVPYYPLAVGSARYAGEPVAAVAARDRYRAEDAGELVVVDYSPLEPLLDPLVAAGVGAAYIGAPSGAVVSDRTFNYGDPDAAFEAADLVLQRRFRFPRWSGAPVECACVVADWNPADRSLTAWANFQGPFTLHTVAAAALGLPASKLRLITPPDSGGSFGVKASVVSYIVALGAVSRILGIPVRWTEDRSEHLASSSMATERITDLTAGFSAEGRLLALRYDTVEDVGAYLRAPEPASLYRMHGTLTGAYRVEHLAVRNRVVLTNRCPTGLNRGFGGPQMYLPLERTMALAAARLELDPAELARRNLLRADEFPHRTASGGLYDSGDYHACLDDALAAIGYEQIRREQAAARSGGPAENCRAVADGRADGGSVLGGVRGVDGVVGCEGGGSTLGGVQGVGRSNGRLLGIGLACVVEPSVSNMGYVSLAEPPERRRVGLPKSGNSEAAGVAMNPLGGVTVRLSTVPQGQGHRTVAAQVVADELGLRPDQVDVLSGFDTHSDAWTVSSGNYSSRFSGIGAAAASEAARRLADRLRSIAAEHLECAPSDVVLRDGRASVAGHPAGGVSLRRLAGQAHWNPESLPADVEVGLAVTAFVSAPNLQPPNDNDEVVAAAAHGFVVDIAVVEVDPHTAELSVLDYVTVHDAGTLLHPRLADGQVLGSFAHGFGPATGERVVYDKEGTLLTGSFMDYLCPTAAEVPPLRILHRETPSPFTPLGAKGLGEGNTMSAPSALANAVCDALGIDDIELPMSAPGIWEAMRVKGLLRSE